MLHIRGQEFTSGASEYFENNPSLKVSQDSIHVNIQIEAGVSIVTTARLDPATPWVVLNSEYNEQLGLYPGEPTVTLATVAGRKVGSLERIPITLLAQEGNTLRVDATVFVCNDWNRENFLGYSGFLQRIRFAVDPQYCRFYFGPLAEE